MPRWWRGRKSHIDYLIVVSGQWTRLYWWTDNLNGWIELCQETTNSQAARAAGTR